MADYLKLTICPAGLRRYSRTILGREARDATCASATTPKET